MSADKWQPTLVRLPKDLHAEAVRYGVERDLSLASVVRSALRAYLAAGSV